MANNNPPATPPSHGLFDRVYVISLPASTARREYVAAHLVAAGLDDFEFHDAMGPENEAVRRAFSDGRVTPFPPCFRCGKSDCGKDDCNNVLIPEQVAVFCTYLELWQKIVQRGECVMVCEDDVVLHPWWGKVLEMIARRRSSGELPWGCDVSALVRLGWAESDEHRDTGMFSLSRAIRMSNPCHLMTPAYAKALVDEFTRFDTTADIFVHQRSKAAQRQAWTAHPPAATELSWSRGAFDSLIHPKPVRSEFLRQSGDPSAADRNDARIETHLNHLFYRDFLIVGHPRCGTGFTAGLMGQMGLDIGHEANGKDGLSSWMFAVDGLAPYARAPVARRREALRWGKLIHAVRNIAEAAPSIMRDNIYAPPSYAFRRARILEAFDLDLNTQPDNFSRAVVSYLRWNKLIAIMQPDLVFRIEHDHAKLRDFVATHASGRVDETGKLDLSPVNANKPYKGVQRPKPHISGEDWAGLPGVIWREVEEFCDTYGYSLPKRAPRTRPAAPVVKVETEGLARQFLDPSGWSRSFAEQAPMRADGTPVPWFTFSAIEFLERIVRRTDRVFEYGAGNSTLWWQDRVTSVLSIEHDRDWTEALRPKIRETVDLRHFPRLIACDPDHAPVVEHFLTRMRRTNWPDYDEAKVIRRGLDDEGFTGYAAAIMKSPEPFDIIIIDGMARRLCAEFAVRKVVKDGIIILDNSNRRDYDAAFDILQEAGFQQIPFWGLVPGANFMTCTSVFVRSLSRLSTGAHRTNSLGLPEY